MSANKINFPHVFFWPTARPAMESWEPRADVYRMADANEKDLRELPDSIRRDMEFIPAERIEHVLKAAIPELASRLSVLSAD
jgi:hypothetical protein